jgi:hypothetical protein
MKKLFLIVFVFSLGYSTTLFAQEPAAKSTGVKQKSDQENLTFSKYFDKESVESTKKFSVSSNFSELRISVEGRVQSGKITITLIKPNNEKLKTIEIDATSEVNYRQEFGLDKCTECIGDWQIKIQAENAEGRYNVNINSRNIGKN